MAKKVLLVNLYTVLIVSTNVILACAEAPPADAECTNFLLSLINCEPFLAGTVATPTETCCLGLGSLIKNAPLCLCGVLTDNPAFSTVNLSRALLLPDECDIPIDAGRCAALNAPPPKTSNTPETRNSPPAPESPASSATWRYWPSVAFLAIGTAAGTTLIV